ncbi:MAG: lysostaphin resistance A-like protein [Roseobacter sp.]
MFKPSDYTPHQALVAPARDKAQVWRLVMGVVLVAGVFLVASQFLHQTLLTLLGPGGYAALTGADGRVTQMSVIFLLLSFGLLTLGVAVALRVVHARGFSEIIGDFGLFRRQFIAVVTLLVLLNLVVMILPPWDMGGAIEPNVPARLWFVVLPFALLAIMVQVSAEEFLFRGYLQQQLAARFASPVIWMSIPAILFGIGHYMPNEAGENANLFVIWAVVFGLLMADLTARAGTLAPAIAVHFINNVIALLFISMPDGLAGLSLYVSPFSMTDTQQVRAWLPVDFAMMLVSWLAARLALRR